MKKLFILWLTLGNLKEMGQNLVFSHQKDGRDRGMMGVRVMEWQ